MTKFEVKRQRNYTYKPINAFTLAIQKLASFFLEKFCEPLFIKAIVKNKHGKESLDGRVKTYLSFIYQSLTVVGWILNKLPKPVLNFILKFSMSLGIDFSKVFMSGLPQENWKQNVSVVFLPDSKNNEIKTSDGKIVVPHQLVIEMLKRVCAYDPEHSIAQIVFCICRLTQDCKDFPVGIGCMVVGPSAKDIVERGVGRFLTLEEAIKEIETQIIPRGFSSFISTLPSDLRHFWGVKPYYLKYSFEICFCCPCCCILKRPLWFLPREPVGKDLFIDIRGFIAKINVNKCTGCGECVKYCTLKKITLIDVIKEGKIQKVAQNKDCIGCGNCVTHCPNKAISIVPTENFDKLEELLGIFEYFDSDIDDVIKKAYKM